MEIIKGVLPSKFRFWHQFLKYSQESIEKYPDSKILIYQEMHPEVTRRYEFTIDEIKSNAFDELLETFKGYMYNDGYLGMDGYIEAALHIEKTYLT